MDEKYLRVLKDGFVSMEMAQNILVVKTVSGMAMAVAAALDAAQWSEVAGCIAGDDTIMCAIRSADDTLLVMDKISKIIEKDSDHAKAYLNQQACAFVAQFGREQR